MNGLASDLPAPVQVLVAAGRHALHQSVATLPSPAAVETADLGAYALRHGMTAFLPHAAAIFDDRHAGVRPELQRAARNHALSVLADTTELLAIVCHLADAGIEFVVLKGPVFAAWLYGDAARRRFVDADLLVRESQRANALRALAKIGFVRRIPEPGADAIYASRGAWPLTRGSGLGVDLHWQLSAQRFPAPLAAAAVIAGAVPVRMADQNVPAPAPADAAVLALLHAAKHVWYALESILAIAWLTRRDDIDWTRVHGLLRRAGAVHAAAAGLELASRLFATSVPDPFVREIDSPAVAQLAGHAYSALRLPPNTFVDRWLERRAHLAAFDRARDRIRYDLRRLFEPTTLEWEWLPLPRALTMLYPPLRIVRLATAPLSGAARMTMASPAGDGNPRSGSSLSA
jgi:putative nucleotidyltransferase-like protein